QREVLQRPAQPAGGQRQCQGVQPQGAAGGETGEHAAAVGLFPYQGAEHGGGQLADGGKRQLADGGQAGIGSEQAVADIGQQQNDQDAQAPGAEHPVAEGFERPLGALAAQQHRQQHVVADHGGQCHGLDDDHAGSRRRSADKGQQGQGRVGLGQRQADDEGVGLHSGRQQQLAGQGNRYDKQSCQQQVQREYPAHQAQVFGFDVFHHA